MPHECHHHHDHVHPAHDAGNPGDEYKTPDDSPIWSGNPNVALVALVESLTPQGSSLDIGSGEGADVRWLAQHGWEAYGIDPSDIAVRRAKQFAQESDDERVRTATTYVEGSFPAKMGELSNKTFGLVTGFYIPLMNTPEDKEALAALVAADGYLVYVHHDTLEGMARRMNVQEEELTTPSELAQYLEETGEWDILTNEERERNISAGNGRGHHTDEVLFARKR